MVWIIALENPELVSLRLGQQSISIQVPTGPEIHFSIRNHRRVKLDTVLGNITTVRNLFCIVEFGGKISRGKGVEDAGGVLESPNDSV